MQKKVIFCKKIIKFDKLSKLENSIVVTKLAYLHDYGMDGEFDSNHLCKLHEFLFKDIYDFNVRTINNFSENIESINTFIRKEIDNGNTVLICLKKYQLRSILKMKNHTLEQ